MNKQNLFIRAATLASSVLLAAGLIAFRGGVFNETFDSVGLASANPPISDPAVPFDGTPMSVQDPIWLTGSTSYFWNTAPRPQIGSFVITPLPNSLISSGPGSLVIVNNPSQIDGFAHQIYIDAAKAQTNTNVEMNDWLTKLAIGSRLGQPQVNASRYPVHGRDLRTPTIMGSSKSFQVFTPPSIWTPIEERPTRGPMVQLFPNPVLSVLNLNGNSTPITASAIVNPALIGDTKYMAPTTLPYLLNGTIPLHAVFTRSEYLMIVNNPPPIDASKYPFVDNAAKSPNRKNASK